MCDKVIILIQVSYFSRGKKSLLGRGERREEFIYVMFISTALSRM